jgi:CubicO group peptidase (beta-lactamase class C family)
MKNRLFTFILLCFIVVQNYAQSPYLYKQPQQLNDGWNTQNFLSKGIDSTRLYQLFSQLKDGKHKVHSILLVKDNELIVEEYYDEYDAAKIHDLRSTSKSIRALLMGIAIDKDFVEDVNDPFTKYLPNLRPKKNLDPKKDQITIKHLLTMSSGLDCNDWDKKSQGQEDRVYKKKDWLQYTVDLPLINEPGTVSNYCSMGSILVAEIISQSSGMTIDQFAAKYLFEPLGIKDVEWGHTSKKKVIDSGKRLYMKPRDMAKIGQLILNKGNWNGRQVIPAVWIEEATTPKTKLSGTDYGYLWWNIPMQGKDGMILSKTATGNGGQYIMIFPNKNLVAVFTGGAYNSPDAQLPFMIMNKVFLPYFE